MHAIAEALLGEEKVELVEDAFYVLEIGNDAEEAEGVVIFRVSGQARKVIVEAAGHLTRLRACTEDGSSRGRDGEDS